MNTDEAFDKVVNGIAVVTVNARGKSNGMTAAWFTRVSFNPPLVMVSVGHSRHTHGLIGEAGSFCLNILAEGQVSLARKFGFASGRNADKFAGVSFREGKTGSPILEGVAGHLDCRLAAAYNAGDHTLFVGEVVDSGASDLKPLASRREDYT